MWGVAEDDEDDMFSAGPSRDSLHYAFDSGEVDDDTIVLGQTGTSGGDTTAVTSATPGSTDRWHDGRPIMAGFILDPKGVPQDKWFVKK